ncbi:MAG: hypothetical protein RL042_802 [Nitrospirota bacterium]|jgi:hypothetical protein
MIDILTFLDVAKIFGTHRTWQKPFEMKTLLNTIEVEQQAQPCFVPVSPICHAIDNHTAKIHTSPRIVYGE